MRVAPPVKKASTCLDTPYATERSSEEIAEVQTLTRRLGRDYWLRKFVHPYTGIAQVPPNQMLSLLSQVTGDYELHWRESMLAASLLGQIDPPEKQSTSAVRELCDLLERNAPNGTQLFANRYAHSSRRAFVLSLAISAIIAALPRLGFPMITPDDTFATLLVVFCISTLVLWMGFRFLILPVSVVVDARRGARVRATVARTLGRWRKPRSVAALAKAANDVSAKVSGEAIRALPGVLASLNESHYGALPSDTVPALCLLLEGHYGLGLDTTERWRVQILTALEKIGDGRAVPTVSHLAITSVIPEIRFEAQRILPVLQERRHQEQSRNTLLRSANAPQESTRELLHPLTESTTPQEELLRSHTGQCHS